MVNVYREIIELVEEMIKAEGVPSPHPRALATLMVLTAEYGAGDAYAGMMLTRIVLRNAETIAMFIEDATGVKPNKMLPSLKTGLLSALETLSKRYETFKALQEMARTGKTKPLYETAMKLGIRINRGSQ